MDVCNSYFDAFAAAHVTAAGAIACLVCGITIDSLRIQFPPQKGNKFINNHHKCDVDRIRYGHINSSLIDVVKKCEERLT